MIIILLLQRFKIENRMASRVRGKLKLSSIPPSKRRVKCPCCQETMRSDTAKRHFERHVLREEGCDDPVPESSPLFKRIINPMKKRHTKYFLQHNYSLKNLPQMIIVLDNLPTESDASIDGIASSQIISTQINNNSDETVKNSSQCVTSPQLVEDAEADEFRGNEFSQDSNRNLSQNKNRSPNEDSEDSSQATLPAYQDQTGTHSRGDSFSIEKNSFQFSQDQTETETNTETEREITIVTPSDLDSFSNRNEKNSFQFSKETIDVLSQQIAINLEKLSLKEKLKQDNWLEDTATNELVCHPCSFKDALKIEIPKHLQNNK